MAFYSQNKRNKRIITLALKILITGKPQLNQKQIVEELEKIGVKIARSTLNRAYKHIDKTGQPTLKSLGKSLPILVEKFTGKVFNDEKNDFVTIHNLPVPPIELSNQPQQRAIKVYEKGRIPLTEKIKFLKTAKKEIIEVGLSLRTLTTYFTSRSKFEYSIHIEKLLKEGINFKFYLLNPDIEIAKLYFEDRGEPKRIAIIKDSIQDLKTIQQTYQSAEYKETFEVFTYQHFPYHHTMLVDGGTANAKMLISHYIYGVRRADCPVLEFTQQGNPILFETYKKSLDLTIKEGIKINDLLTLNL